MRRKQEISIFSMSALDLFASALGAFILISVVLFPFFPNITDKDLSEMLQQARQQLQETQQRLENCQSELQQAQRGLEEAQEELQRTQETLDQCSAELRKKFLLVLMSWGNEDDIDLHVVDPQGNEFFYSEKTHPGTPAELEEDNTRGPGNEIWLHPQATQGEYKIYYKYFSKRASGTTIDVRGAILTPKGKRSIPIVRLTNRGDKPLVATVTIDGDGEASVRVW